MSYVARSYICDKCRRSRKRKDKKHWYCNVKLPRPISDTCEKFLAFDVPNEVVTKENCRKPNVCSSCIYGVHTRGWEDRCYNGRPTPQDDICKWFISKKKRPDLDAKERVRREMEGENACISCFFRGYLSSFNKVCCDYIGIMGHSRPCPPACEVGGKCDCWQKK